MSQSSTGATAASTVTRLLSVGVVLALVVAAALTLFGNGDRTYVTASFPRTVSLYEGSDVRILGVPVGQVEKVTPKGTQVEVRLWVDGKHPVPADAQAVIVTPAIVGDRYVQLTPAYTGGEKLVDGARLDATRTAVPLELDEIYQSIDDLTVALGPEGANADGALSRLLDATARNFGGQGKQFNETIRNLGQLTGTLDDNKDALFGTVDELGEFVGVLAENDDTVRAFNQSLAGAADLLEGEREDLATALDNLGVALGEVGTFVRENRGVLRENITGLKRLSRILVKQRDALTEVLDVAPLALNNLFHTYNPATGTLDTRANITEALGQIQAGPGAFLCGLLLQLPGGKQGCDLLKGLLPAGSANRPAPGAGEEPRPPVDVERVDRTLGGLLGGDR
ncbi:phospholipid/cholesterol/gamma-HCH transport system substrate-binding protein [Nocardioides massiliensis]|uniref:Phospholipid/cholesterol/gamma-HCH transport system substrate-binding protein n=2 Tax=Nocardioides massiliensis TaxID=1325935 RepID=A0ABT9NNY9_9ACTN|nr:MCE family protein [Nocardioides massiliensis]MDP9821987.1 phospholipid/cholesterol/gamma-HCH transport system substrate-binding protein [Nocardioides massiliensis]